MKKLLPLILILLLFASCTASGTERTLYVMDTVATVKLFPENEKAADEIETLLSDMSDSLSAYDGKLKEINDTGGGEMDEYLSELYLISKRMCDATSGAFSPYLGSLIELWSVGEKNYIPADDEIKKALATKHEANANFSGNMLSLKNGQRLNFGAIAKGYATDKVRGILIESDVSGAVVSIGGNVYVHGEKDNGEKFLVAVRDPQGSENEWILALPLSERFVITSGDYERFFEEDGRKYHHILDPETGYPAESDLLACCVVSENGAEGDALSTALYVMGKETAISFWREREGFELVLIGRDRTVTLTEGLAESFVPNEEKEYTYEVAKR